MTSSGIGILLPNESVRSIYCNQSSQIWWTGMLLCRHFTDSDAIRKLIDGGDISGIGQELANGTSIPVVEYFGSSSNQPITWQNIGEYSHKAFNIHFYGADLLYLWDGSTWLFQERRHSRRDWRKADRELVEKYNI